MIWGVIAMGNLSLAPVRCTESHQSELLLRGIPWGATVSEVALFLLGRGFQAAESDVTLCTDKRKRFNGRAIVQCKSTNDAIGAQSAVHGSIWGKRYIEAFMRSRSVSTFNSEPSDLQFGALGQTH